MPSNSSLPPPNIATVAAVATVAPAAAPRRAVCAACLRAQRTCICHWMAPVAVDTALLILQHPLEVRQAKGSARLLHLCIPGSAMLTGEQFDAAELDAALHAGGRTPLLLYPDPAQDRASDDNDADAGLPAAPSSLNIAAQRGQGARLRLVVLDGTWRKSRKMLYLNPALAALPRLALRDTPASHYHIRKAHAPDQLSSFEAAAYALTALQVDGAAELIRLLDAFDGFVGQQAALAAAAPENK